MTGRDETQMKLLRARCVRVPVLVAAAALSIAVQTLFVAAAQAQNLFAPVAQVNEQIVTRYELDQRMRLLTILGGGTSEKVALDALIEERLKSEAAARAGIEATDEIIAEGIQEFAARGDLAPEQLLTLLARNGVSAQTLRDFVANSLVWRDLARARFAAKAQVSEAEIDQALESNGPSGGLRVLLSEIFLPARNPSEKAQSEAIARRFTTNPTIAKFAAAARQYSVAPSRARSGRLEWVPIGNLPPPLRNQILGMAPGNVTSQLSTGNAIGYFQLRAIEEIETPTPAADAIEYAAYYIAGGRSEAALAEAQKVEAKVDTCDDLYGIAKGQPESVLEIDTLPVADIPQDVALELAKLDTNEISTALTRADGQTLVFLMLCGRSYEARADADRESIRQRLQSARIGALADSYLAQIKADAAIVIP